MQKYSIHFEISQGRKTKNGMLVPTNYNFWEPLLSHFRIDCWIDEVDKINI